MTAACKSWDPLGEVNRDVRKSWDPLGEVNADARGAIGSAAAYHHNLLHVLDLLRNKPT